MRRAITCAVSSALAALASHACHATTFTCASNESCSGGVCQPTGYCSFPDDGCPAGQRYGDHAAPGYAGTCVGPGDASTSGAGASTSTAEVDASTMDPSETSRGDDSPSPDVGGPAPECVDIEFDVVPLPGWMAAPATDAPVTVDNGRLTIELPDTGAAMGGIQRDALDVVARSFAIDLLSGPDPDSLAQVGLTVVHDGTSYGLFLRGGNVHATYDAGDGEVELATMEYADANGMTLRIVLDGVVSFEVGPTGGTATALAEQGGAPDEAEVTLVASTPDGNMVPPGPIEIERLQDCPTASEVVHAPGR